MGEKIDGMENVDFSTEHRFVGTVQGAKGLKGELRIGLLQRTRRILQASKASI